MDEASRVHELTLLGFTPQRNLCWTTHSNYRVTGCQGTGCIINSKGGAASMAKKGKLSS